MPLVADAALLRARMDTDMAHPRLASGMAVPIEAAYRRGLPDRLLLAVRGSGPRGVGRAPLFRYKCTSPRFKAELPTRSSLPFSRRLTVTSSGVVSIPSESHSPSCLLRR